jgi:hypothetical protein
MQFIGGKRPGRRVDDAGAELDREPMFLSAVTTHDGLDGRLSSTMTTWKFI